MAHWFQTSHTNHVTAIFTCHRVFSGSTVNRHIPRPLSTVALSIGTGTLMFPIFVLSTEFSKILKVIINDNNPVVYSINFRVLLTRALYLILKELEHRKFGWKVLILKYVLGKSLSKEM